MKRVHRSAAQGTEYGELLVLDVGAGKNIESSSTLETAGGWELGGPQVHCMYCCQSALARIQNKDYRCKVRQRAIAAFGANASCWVLVLVRGGTYPQRQWPRRGTCELPGRGEHAGATVRTRARGADDGAGLARCKWTAHGTATQRQLKAAAAPATRSDAKRQNRKKKKKGSKAKTAATTQLGLEAGMHFETQPLAAARLIGRGRQPLQPVQRHRGAVVRPKQRTSSLNKPCRALPSRVATLQSPPPKGPPRPRWCSRPRHPPITAAGRAGSPPAHRGFPGLEIRVPSPRFCELATTNRTLGNDGKRAKARESVLALALASGGGSPTCWRCDFCSWHHHLCHTTLFSFQPFCTTCSQHRMRVESDCRRRLNATPLQTQMRCAVLAAGR